MTNVQIRCAAPHGLILRVAGQQIQIAGNDQLTNVNAALWAQWLHEHEGASVLTTGQLYESPNAATTDEIEDATAADVGDADEPKPNSAKKAKGS